MTYLDISQPIRRDMVVWPNDPGVAIEIESDICCGADLHLTRISLGCHTGTHLDAPLHFEPDGISVDELELDVLIGPCRVVHLPDVAQHIERAHLEGLGLEGCARVLFKTSNGARFETGTFQSDFVAVAPSAAELLVELGVRLVGVDYLSVEPFVNDNWRTHHTLLRAGVIVVEGLDMRAVPPGDYQLMALPLLIEGAEGAPVRAVLSPL